MTHAAYDVFNGDADGICALHQLRLAAPREAQLVTGVKREIDLLRRVPSDPGIAVTVLDVSLDTNVASLRRLLDGGAQVTYFDHHSAHQAFEHPGLTLFWDESPDVCTSILVDRHLRGRFRAWAVAAAFGDNLAASARGLAARLGLDDRQTGQLAELGLLLNYNAYGENTADLHIAPEALYRALQPFADPLDFIAACPDYNVLADGYRADAARMDSLQPEWKAACGAVYVLPSQPWARRISGVFANQLICPEETRSYAVLTENADGSYVVSVRSGAPALRAAHGLCEQFATGGGRKAAGGINCLPANEVPHFIETFSAYFAGHDAAT